jgi:hypothetical protein
MDSILPPEIDKQGSSNRERKTRKAQKEKNKMKSLQLMNLANIRGKTRAKSTMSQHQSEYEIFLLLYLYKHADQLLGPEMLAPIRYITDDIDDIPIHDMKKARSVIRSFS